MQVRAPGIYKYKHVLCIILIPILRARYYTTTATIAVVFHVVYINCCTGAMCICIYCKYTFQVSTALAESPTLPALPTHPLPSPNRPHQSRHHLPWAWCRWWCRPLPRGQQGRLWPPCPASTPWPTKPHWQKNNTPWSTPSLPPTAALSRRRPWWAFVPGEGC